ncbi:MAG: carboxymuconolactone decarboxylase family protein [Phycisphaerales bacterium]
MAEQPHEHTPTPTPTPHHLAAQRRELTPDATAAFLAFSGAVFAAGALDGKTKQIIAVAVAHVTQCQQCIRSHTKSALRAGATPRELMEAAWVAAEMRAGGAYAHSNVMLAAIHEEQAKPEAKP